MAVYVPLNNVPLQFVDVNGDPLVGGTLEFYLSGTSTPANLYSDNTGTSIGTSLTLDSSGYPASGGNVITLFRDTSISYKVICKDASAVTVWTSDTLNSNLAVLASTATSEGASLIGVEDSAANFTGTDVEAVLAELQTNIDSLTTSLTDADSFTGTLVGCTTSPTQTFYYIRTGIGTSSVVNLYLRAALTATSNTTALSFTGLPAAIQPVNSRIVKCAAITDAGTQHLDGYAVVSASTSVTFALEDGAAFTNSGTKGLQAFWSITYGLD